MDLYIWCRRKQTFVWEASHGNPGSGPSRSWGISGTPLRKLTSVCVQTQDVQPRPIHVYYLQHNTVSNHKWWFSSREEIGYLSGENIPLPLLNLLNNFKQVLIDLEIWAFFSYRAVRRHCSLFVCLTVAPGLSLCKETFKYRGLSLRHFAVCLVSVTHSDQVPDPCKNVTSF